MNIMLDIIGFLLIGAGLLVAIFGNLVVNKKVGRISKLVGWSAGRPKWFKFVVGIALIYAGVMILIQ